MSRGRKLVKVDDVRRYPFRCDRCGRRYRGHGDWNVTLAGGVIVGALCPDCQNTEEHLEAAINEATLSYDHDELGRITSCIQAGDQETQVNPATGRPWTLKDAVAAALPTSKFTSTLCR